MLTSINALRLPEFYIGAGNDLESTNFEGHVSFDLCRESSASIATGFGLDGQGIGIRFPVRARDFSPLHDILTGSGPCPVGAESCLPSNKTAMA
jgi:hypothetical protein